MQTISETQTRNSLRIANADSVSRPRKNKWILQDRQIHIKGDQVAGGRISVLEFLTSVSGRIRSNANLSPGVDDTINLNLAALEQGDQEAAEPYDCQGR